MDAETLAAWKENYSALGLIDLIQMKGELEKFTEDAEHLEIVNGILKERRDILARYKPGRAPEGGEG